MLHIPYSVTKNNFIRDSDVYRAAVQSIATANMNQVIERMIAHGCTASLTDIQSMIYQCFEVIIGFLLEGYRVNLPWLHFSISIRGNFNSKTDSFSPDRHSIEVITTPSARLRLNIREHAHVHKELASRIKPELLQYTDWNSGQRDSSLTPSGIGEIIGKHLKFDRGKPDQGIFFIAGDGNAHRAEVVSHNTNSKLTFLAPANLTSGDYVLEVRANLGQGPLRSGSLEGVLTVS